MTGNLPESGFFFVRHGQTAANRDGIRSGGDSDTRLTELGRTQAREVSATLQSLGVTPRLILTAPLSRTMETAELLNAPWGVEVRLESGLLERRLGEWNGLGVEETQPSLAAGETPPGGESNTLFHTRVLAAFRELAPHYSRWPLIVSSRGVARVLMEHAGRDGAASLSNGAILRVSLADPDDGVGFEVAGIDYLRPPSETV